MATYEAILDEIQTLNTEILTHLDQALPSKIDDLGGEIHKFITSNPKEEKKIALLLEQIEELRQMYAVMSSSLDQSSSHAKFAEAIGSSISPAPELIDDERPVPSLVDTAAGASSRKRTRFADYFDSLESKIREYLNLKAKSKKSMQDIMKLSSLEIAAQTVLPAQEGGVSIDKAEASLPKLNNPGLNARVQPKLDEYPLKRQVRGDGNCYYRAIIYAYLEQAMVSDRGMKAELIDRLNDKLTALIGQFGQSYDQDLSQLIDLLTKLRNDELATNQAEFEALVAHPSRAFDHLMVRAARALTADALLQPETAELASPYVANYDDYIRDTLSMKKDGDSPAVELNLLGQALGVNVSLENIQPDGSIQDVDLAPLKGSGFCNIHLLRDNTGEDNGDAHYFLLYDTQQADLLATASTAPSAASLRK